MVNQQPALYMDLLIMARNHDNDLPNWNMEDIKIFAYLKWNRFKGHLVKAITIQKVERGERNEKEPLMIKILEKIRNTLCLFL